ncbi:predicted protein [Botrytis cinerea T4]|uniref:Uncharacterized protein n=1 Tax=Botryotinia fuckeliana (strain T4) TaxID=999810 RepID=G2XP83_BOTF4|nr:predicted protein [Botrytis cinerea T4]
MNEFGDYKQIKKIQCRTPYRSKGNQRMEDDESSSISNCTNQENQ